MACTVRRAGDTLSMSRVQSAGELAAGLAALARPNLVQHQRNVSLVPDTENQTHVMLTMNVSCSGTTPARCS